MKKQPTLSSRIQQSAKENVKSATRELQMKRKLLATTFCSNMARWAGNEIEAAALRGLEVEADSVQLYAGYSAVTLYVTIRNVPSLKSPLFADFIERLMGIWTEPEVSERDYVSEDQQSAYRDYTFTWRSEADLGFGYTQGICFRVSMTAFIANADERKCHIEVVEEKERVVVDRTMKIVCD